MKFNGNLNESNKLYKVLDTVLRNDLCMAVITASRNDKSDEENSANNAKLRKTLRDYGFGYRHVIGHYPETNKDGKRVLHKDDSSLIIGSQEDEELLLKLSISICREYEQESVLFKHCDGRVRLYDGNGSVLATLGKFRPGAIGDYMTKLKRGKTFVFESISEWHNGYAQNHLSALLRRERIKRLMEG